MDLARQGANQVNVKLGCCGFLAVCACFCTILGSTIALVVYLGVYAYNNPDVTDCWYVDGMTVGETTAQAALDAATKQGLEQMEPINVHQLFTAWFAWAFWTALLPCLCAPVITLVNCFQIQALDTLVQGAACLTACCSTLWLLILGAIWRFGNIGDACTEDALPLRKEGVSDDDW